MYSGFNLRDDEGRPLDNTEVVRLKVPKVNTDKLTTEATPRRLYANAHTYHINSISVNSDDCTFLSADDLRINLWHLETTDQSFSILCYHIVYFIVVHVCVSDLYSIK